MNDTPSDKSQDQLQHLSQQKRVSMAGEFWVFLKQNKKWWLLPILLILLGLGVLVALSSTTLAPFIYPLF
jgi:hypothetical protein